MTTPACPPPRPSRSFYVVDLIFLAVAFAGFDLAMAAVPVFKDFRINNFIATATRCAMAVVFWGWLRFRGDTAATIGLRRPRSWSISLLSGTALVAAMFAAVYLLERAGLRRDLTGFAGFKGNLELTIYECFSVAISAGFVEEFIFRGFLFQRLAMLFGGSNTAWAIACIIQAIVFGYGHTYQNPMGVLLTGAIGFLLGLVFLATARNLWIPIIAHAGYDVGRTIAFYFLGIPPW